MILGIGGIFNGIGQLTKTFSCQKPNAQHVPHVLLVGTMLLFGSHHWRPSLCLSFP
jgi:hypothetical protein